MRIAAERLIAERLGDDRFFQRLGTEPGIQPEVCREVRHLDPGQAVDRVEGNHRDRPKEDDDQRHQPKEAGKRASTAGMGTHRNPMLGRRSYGDRFPDPGAACGRDNSVTISVATPAALRLRLLGAR